MSNDGLDDPNTVRGEPFDRWLHASACDYNRPSDEALSLEKRDAMWQVVERSLQTSTASPTIPTAVPTTASTTASTTAPTSAPSKTVIALPLVRARRVGTSWWQLAAALLLLAGGIGIGRQWRGATPQVPGVASSDSRDSTSRVGSASYDVATVAHLSRAEALLTSFRGRQGHGTEASAVDGSMNRWARDLLADTRLLLDSPAATEAHRRALLEDLEMLLAQIVQLPAESSADRSLVQRSIERGAVLSRLRSSIPAGFSSGT